MRKNMAFMVVILLMACSPGLAQGGPPDSPCSPEAAPKWGAEVAGVRIAVAPAKSEFRVGEPVEVTVCLNNVSPQPVQLSWRAGVPPELVILNVRTRRKATLTRDGLKAYSPDLDRALVGMTLSPGMTSMATENVAKLFDVSEAGRYSITVASHPIAGSPQRARSEPIEIVISPKE